MNPPTDIQSWLDGLGLGELAPVFVENHITPDVLHDLTADDLREMGITSLGHRKQLLAALAGKNAASATIAPVRQQPEPTPEPVIQDVYKSKPRTLVPVKASTPVVTRAVAPAPVIREVVSPVVEPVAMPADLVPPPTGRKPRRKGFSGPFLLVSVIVHLLLGVGAVYWVVQKIETKRKLQFASAPPTANPSKRALEHKVSLQKKKNAGGSPAQAKRIAVTGLASKITLPEMPNIPTTSTQLVAGRMAGMGGAGFGSGLGFGNGSGMGVGGMGGGGLGLTMFGARGGVGLVGRFYDLKQTPDGQPTELAPQGNASDAQYMEEVRKFVANWDPRVLERFYRSPNTLVAQQLYIPICPSDDAAKAFGEQKRCSGYRWLVHYKGTVVAPRDGTFRFIGRGDNIMMVRLNSKHVLDGGFPAEYQVDPGVNTDKNLGLAGPKDWTLSGGAWFDVRRGDLMKIEVVIGDGGGLFNDYLLIEEKGVRYSPRRDAEGALAYPVFQTADVRVPKPTRSAGGADPETARQPIIFPSLGSTNALDILGR